MRIKQESEILDQVTRKRIIEEIKGQENQARKAQSYKWHQCYKDNTRQYVVENMLNQFDFETVLEMRYSIANISFMKKVVDKLARVYSNGVSRSLPLDTETQKLKNLEKQLCINTELKTTNRYLRAQRNTALYIKPCPVQTESGTKWTIKPQPLVPYLYDVVEDYYDRTKPLCFILSNYKAQNNPMLDLGDAGYHNRTATLRAGNSIDEKIADNPIDEGMGEPETFIFWSNSYHFTCNVNGEIITDSNNPNNLNPFGIAPIVNFAIDQDGHFWAQGGSDLPQGSILLNSILTHANHIAVTQGYGQAFMTGENLPSKIKIGPTRVIRGEYKKDEQPQPTFEFVSTNPQLDSIRSLIEAYLALLLTTNNLSTSGIASQLNGSQSAASGIALIIDKAESLEDVQDQRQIFLDREPVVWKIINKIIDTYGEGMIDELKVNKLNDGFDKLLNIVFFDPTPIMSEKEKLENLKVRLELGLDSMLDLIMKDNPMMSKQMAEEKLKSILAEQIMLKSKQMNEMVEDESESEETEEDLDDEDTENKGE